jgi:hypothetical protein
MAHGSAQRDGGFQGPFLLLILAQTLHSTEEYVFRLWEHLAPARYVAGLFGVPPPLGFILSNSLLVGLGLWCWLALVRPQRPSGRVVAWCWGVGELLNGLGHIALACGAGGYFPGLYTVPLLLGAGAWLVARLRRTAAPGPIDSSSARGG